MSTVERERREENIGRMVIRSSCVHGQPFSASRMNETINRAIGITEGARRLGGGKGDILIYLNK